MSKESKEGDEAQRQFDAGRQRHERFKQHAQEYNQASQAHQVDAKSTRDQLADAMEHTAGVDEPDAEAWQTEVERLQQEQHEQAMIREGLSREFKDLQAEFRNLEKPENDIVELGRKVRKIRGRGRKAR